MVTKKSAKAPAVSEGPSPVRARILEAAFSAFMERGFPETPRLELAPRAARARVPSGTQLIGEVSDPAVVAVFRLAISEAARAPEVAQTLADVAIAASREALREIMRRGIDARLLGGGAPEMAEHFFGLLWGSRMLGLLLNIAERPSAREAGARAERAASAFLLAIPGPRSLC